MNNRGRQYTARCSIGIGATVAPLRPYRFGSAASAALGRHPCASWHLFGRTIARPPDRATGARAALGAFDASPLCRFGRAAASAAPPRRFGRASRLPSAAVLRYRIWPPSFTFLIAATAPPPDPSQAAAFFLRTKPRRRRPAAPGRPWCARSGRLALRCQIAPGRTRGHRGALWPIRPIPAAPDRPIHALAGPGRSRFGRSMPGTARAAPGRHGCASRHRLGRTIAAAPHRPRGRHAAPCASGAITTRLGADQADAPGPASLANSNKTARRPAGGPAAAKSTVRRPRRFVPIGSLRRLSQSIGLLPIFAKYWHPFRPLARLQASIPKTRRRLRAIKAK